jgi:hypothetical protein
MTFTERIFTAASLAILMPIILMVMAIILGSVWIMVGAVFVWVLIALLFMPIHILFAGQETAKAYDKMLSKYKKTSNPKTTTDTGE